VIRVVLAALALATLLTLPFVLRSAGAPGSAPRSGSGATETVIIMTPDNEAIRSEMGRAFRAHMARRGRAVEVDWRAPGGTSEIGRYLSSQYAVAFELYWTRQLGRRWSPEIAAGYSRAPSPSPSPSSPSSSPAADARRVFLASPVGIGIDLLFGGGPTEFTHQAAAGRLVDSGIRQRHPEWFGPQGIPEEVGGERTWDRDGRWVGVCFSTFGICFNHDALARLRVPTPPSSWGALAEPVFHGELALADPTKSGSVGKAFEMIIQSQVNQARRRMAAAGALDEAALDRSALTEGWAAAMRLIRRVGGNARYFTDAATRVPLDVSTGDAAAGMCIDFYGRFQSEVTNVEAGGGRPRMGFRTARGETGVNADPIALLRGAPHPALALEFIEFVLSEEGQKVWAFRRGTPGGPERYTLHRLPVLPRLYDHAFDQYRADPDDNPYEDVRGFVYRESLTGPLFNAISFIVKAMCIDPADELTAAAAALAAAHFPPRATALFDDVSAVDYATVAGPVRAALQSPDPLDAARLSARLVAEFRAQYRRVAALARAEGEGGGA